MATKTLIKRFPIGELFPVKFHLNVRDETGKTYNVDGLKDQIFQAGRVLERIWVHMRTVKDETGKEKLILDQIIKGFRRTTCVGLLKEQFPHDRRWDEIEAEVLCDLTEAELTELLIDQGNVEPLKKHEVLRAVWMFLRTNPTITDQALTVSLRGLLVQYFPGGAGIPANDVKALGDHYRGVIQNMRNGFRLPVVAQDYFMREVKGEFAWPKKRQDVAALVKVHEDEAKADSTGHTTKESPGPAFLKMWAEVVKKLESEPTTRAKSVGMMTRKEVEQLRSAASCPILSQISACILRDISESDSKLLKLAEIYNKLVIPMDIAAQIATLMGAPATATATAPATAPAAVAPPAPAPATPVAGATGKVKK